MKKIVAIISTVVVLSCVFIGCSAKTELNTTETTSDDMTAVSTIETISM